MRSAEYLLIRAERSGSVSTRWTALARPGRPVARPHCVGGYVLSRA
ncbi:MAG TPA: hypothetical protein VMA95_06435 [Streptosporangiaceae bacterium]|nr:hypothetical protein [Streptosporangiaceae bacterium]